MKWLLDKNADIYAQNMNGETASQLADNNGHNEIVDLIHKHDEMLKACFQFLDPDKCEDII